jgi:hypothetical protein
MRVPAPGSVLILRSIARRCVSKDEVRDRSYAAGDGDGKGDVGDDAAPLTISR